MNPGKTEGGRARATWPFTFFYIFVTTPTWLDERGQPRAKRPCPACGREIAVVTLPPEHLRFWGWQPLRLSGYIEWCGHRVEDIPVPDLKAAGG